MSLEKMVAKITEALAEASDGVPFGQSVFQNTFLADDAHTPGRKLRYILLQMSKKRDALQHCAFRRRRLEIDLRELRDSLKAAKGFAAERLAIDIEEKEWAMTSEKKLIVDAMVEAETFFRLYKLLPKTSRDEFEAAERGYWVEHFSEAARAEVSALGAVSVGTITALRQVGVVVKRSGAGLKFLPLKLKAVK